MNYLDTDIKLDGTYRPLKVNNTDIGLLAKEGKVGTNQIVSEREDLTNKDYVDSRFTDGSLGLVNIDDTLNVRLNIRP